MKAVVMAGGEGSRLRPLTCQIPKPMVPVMNRPLIEYTADLLYYHGIHDVAVTLQYLPEQIREHFGDGSAHHLRMRYYVEDEPLGTAGSVKNAAPFLDQTFIVISGDALTDIDLTNALEFHRRKGAMATLVLTPVVNPLEYGLVITSEDGRITRFVEKPGWGEVFSDTVNTGIYILEPEVLEYVEPGQMVDFSKDVFPRLLENNEPLFGCVLPGYWCDVGNLEQYCRAHRDILSGGVNVNLKARESEKGIWMEEGVEVHPRASVSSPSYLGEGTYLGPGVEIKETVLGPHNWLENCASVKRGITWERACLERKASVRGAVLCSRVRVGSRSAIYESSVIGDSSILEEGVLVKPEIKIWPEKRVESGTILRENLIWGTRGMRSLFGVEGVKGEGNREITPEIAAKVGASYAALLKEGSVLVSSDGSRLCRMLEYALSSGLVSAGKNVFRLGESVVPVTRRLMLKLGSEGGVHLRCYQSHPPMVQFKFLDRHGMNISRGEERKIEQNFFRGDFNRFPGSEVGEEMEVPALYAGYRQDLLRQLKQGEIQRAGFRIVWGYPTPLLQKLLHPLMQQMGCRVITLHAGGTEQEELLSFKSLRSRRREVAQAVRQHAAHLGVIMDPDGEQMLLIDEKGRIVEEETYTALLSLLVFRAGRGETVAVPVNATSAIEELAERYQGKVRRTKTAPRFRMEELLEAGNGQREDEIFRGGDFRENRISSFSLYFDAAAALLYLLEFLAVEETRLSYLLSDIPEIRLRQKEIPCPWGKKGIIMRRLIEDAPPERVEMVDGLKVHHSDGWALVLPDAEKPSYHVYGEGFNQEISASLTDFYAKKIHRLQQET